MKKLLYEFLREPSNNLYPYINEFLESSEENRNNIDPNQKKKVEVVWSSQSGNGEGLVSFPEGTQLKGFFKNYCLEKGFIQFPTGVRLEGTFAKFPKYMIGLFQSGKVSFPDGSYLSIECKGLKVIKKELFNSKGLLHSSLDNTDIQYYKDQETHTLKKFDQRTFTITVFDSFDQSNIIEETTYSYFGLYYSIKSLLQMNSKFFIDFQDQITKVDRAFPTDMHDMKMFLENTHEYSNKLLCFALNDCPGCFVFKVDNIENPEYGEGFYRNGPFKITVQLLVSHSSFLFLYQNKIYNSLAFKRLLNSLLENYVPPSTIGAHETFIEVNDDELTVLEQKLNNHSEEDKYLILLTEMVEKYEICQRMNDNEKSRLNAQLNEAVNANTALAQENDLMLEKISKLITENAVVHKAHQKSFDTVSQLTKALQKVNSSISALSNKNLDLEKANCELKKVYNAKEKEFMMLVKNFTTLERDFKEELKAMKERVWLVQQENQKLVEQRLQSDSALKKLKEDNEIQTLELLSRIEELKEQIENAEKPLESSVHCLSEELRKAIALNSSLEKNIHGLNLQLHDQTDLIQNQQWLIEKLSKEVEQMSANQIKDQIIEFSGKLVDGKKEGKGSLKTAEFEYEGNFKNDKFYEKGKLLYLKSNKLLEGDFDSEGHFTGNYIKIGNAEYHGNLARNKMEGKGALYFRNNYIIEGLFKNDGLVAGESYLISNLSDGSEDVGKVEDGNSFHLTTTDSSRYLADFASGELKKL